MGLRCPKPSYRVRIELTKYGERVEISGTPGTHGTKLREYDRASNGGARPTSEAKPPGNHGQCWQGAAVETSLSSIARRPRRTLQHLLEKTERRPRGPCPKTAIAEVGPGPKSQRSAYSARPATLIQEGTPRSKK